MLGLESGPDLSQLVKNETGYARSPRNATASRLRAGYSIIEVMLSIAVLGILSIGLIQGFVASTRTRGIERHRTTALLIARNTAARLTAAGPAVSPLPVGVDTVRSDGAHDPDGSYEVTVAAEVSCVGGSGVPDNALAPGPLAGDCPGAAPVLQYTVTVRYPDPNNGYRFGAAIATRATVGGRDPGSGTIATEVP